MKGIISGEGTQLSPYLIEDVYDFLALEEKNGTAEDIKYAKLVNNIDYNDHDVYKNGLRWADFPKTKDYIYDCNYIILDGNNKEVRNMVFINWAFGTVNKPTDYQNYMRFYEIKNCIFTNIVFSLCGAYLFSKSSWLTANKIQNCNISCYSIKSHLNGIMPTGMYESTINIKGSSNSVSQELANKNFIKSRINFDNYNITYSTNIAISAIDLDRSYITGKVTFSSSSNLGYAEFFKTSVFTNSYLALEIICKTGNGGLSSPTFMPTCKTICFYDSTLSKTANASANLIGLSTEDCKSIEKLQEIGFLAIEV